MINEIATTIRLQGLKQVEAARVCRTDAASLSKVLHGKSRQVSIEKLAEWLSALGRKVTIEIDGSTSKSGQPSKIVIHAVEFSESI
jgi:predicted XRE-type DNA-binding protein